MNLSNFQGKETAKGITTTMLVVIGAIFVALIVLIVVIAFANEESGSGGLGITIGKGICGFLATSMGGFGSAICNI
ncbi:MAG: hypothetical protein HY051_06435 [Candidatus Aenigmarchaeota archaeon]|nr:hypothetical protein [Candidatus Aenigmarchaeota archaeon]